MKYGAVIIDDELKLREVLSIKIEAHLPSIKILDKTDSAENGYKSIIKHKPDIVFLDISMPGESGFDMLKRFQTIDFEIIFVTGYYEYGLEALKVSAVDYILKPVKTEDLISAVEKAYEKLQRKEIANNYQNLLHNINHVGDQDSKLAIPGINAYDFIKVRDIIRCEGWQKYTKIHLMDGSTLVSSYNLGMYKEMLIKYGFYETHKSHIVNMNHIGKYLKEGTIVMTDDSQVPVSRRRKDEFLQFLLKST